MLSVTAPVAALDHGRYLLWEREMSVRSDGRGPVTEVAL